MLQESSRVEQPQAPTGTQTPMMSFFGYVQMFLCNRAALMPSGERRKENAQKCTILKYGHRQALAQTILLPGATRHDTNTRGRVFQNKLSSPLL